MSTTRRKRIGLLVSFPEAIHVRRITEGIRSRCEYYGYDLCIFASSIHISFPMYEYVAGEANIYELANFGELDGLILDHSTLSGSKDEFVLSRIKERLLDYPDLPVCCLESELEGTKFIENDNEETLRELCRHAIEVHGKKKICILTGQKGNFVAEKRLSVFLDEAEKHGLSVLPEHIIYGDFWYTSGNWLADDIADGKVERPEAVLCASDCMALGLINKLTRRGIKVPEDIIVIGFDSTEEGAINAVTLSSFEPNDVDMGHRAVDYIRGIIEPSAPLAERGKLTKGKFHPGASCGCDADPFYIIRQVRTKIFSSTNYYSESEENQLISVGALMENYVLEKFTSSKNVDECMGNIFGSAGLLKPYSNMYLCLKEDWLDIMDERTIGYPVHMRVCVKCSTVGEEQVFAGESEYCFETSRMIPKLDEDREKPGIFNFLPVHFNGKLLGYTVIERDISETETLNIVIRNWLRYINNGLEMIRSKNGLEVMSVRDEMTGAYNRRGMYLYYKEQKNNASPGDALFVAVVDVDGLKYINDTFGHKEGDFTIKTVCDVLRENLKENEICVRSGGDEFFIIGIGSYKKQDESDRAEKYLDEIKKRSEMVSRSYNISASIGCMVYEDIDGIGLDSALSEADERMYRYKFRHRKHRGV